MGEKGTSLLCVDRAQLAKLNVVLTVAIASGSPTMLMATQMSLSAGSTTGIAVGTGLQLLAAIRTMIALLGFGVVLRAVRRVR